MNFWDRLDWLLKERNLSRKQLSDLVGCSPSAISVWKFRQSYPDADIALAIAQTLGVTVEYLLQGPPAEGLQAVQVDIQSLSKIYTISNENQELQDIFERLLGCEPAQVQQISEVMDVLLRGNIRH